MAEVIGLVASLGSIAAAGFSVAKMISTIADELGEAGTQINGIATDMRAVSLIVHELKRRLEKAEKITREVRHVAHEIVALCKADIADIEEFVIPLMSPAGKNVGLKQKIKWLFAKAKVSSRRAALDSLKLTLTLFLHTLGFIESGQIDEYMKEEVHVLILETQHTKTTLIHAEQADRKCKKTHESSDNEGHLSSTVLQIEGGDITSEGADTADTASSQALIDTRSSDSNNDEKKQMQRVNASWKADSEPTEPLGSISDDDFVQIAEHIRLQHLVKNLALRVMYPKSGYYSEDTRFRDETTGRGHEWQDGYVGPSSHHIPRPGTTMSATGDSETELDKTKLELKESRGQIEQLNEQLNALRAEKTAREETDKYKIREIDWLNEQLKAFQAERTSREEAEKWKAREEQIRKDAEAAFAARMEAMRKAQEEAKVEIAKAKKEAEDAARDRLEAERKAEEERARQHAEFMREAEKKARRKLEISLRAEEEARAAAADQKAQLKQDARDKIEAEVKEAIQRAQLEQDARDKMEAEVKEAEMKWRKEVREKEKEKIAHEAARMHLSRKIKRDEPAPPKKYFGIFKKRSARSSGSSFSS